MCNSRQGTPGSLARSRPLVICGTLGQLWNLALGSAVEPWANCGTLGQLWNLGSAVEPWANCGTLGQLWNPGSTVEPWVSCGTLGQLWNPGSTVEPLVNGWNLGSYVQLPAREVWVSATGQLSAHGGQLSEVSPPEHAVLKSPLTSTVRRTGAIIAIGHKT